LRIVDAEWQQLEDDRRLLRKIFPRPNAKIYLPCNLRRLIWTAQKIFHVDLRKPVDLNPLRVIEGVKEVSRKLVIVSGDDRIRLGLSSSSFLLGPLLRSLIFQQAGSVQCHSLDEHSPSISALFQAGGNESQVCSAIVSKIV
jgi:hypothetical protein